MIAQLQEAKRLLKNPPKSMLDLLATLRYLVKCETCGKVFIDLNYREFLNKHDFYNPDRWFLDVVLHFYETETKHNIICTYPMPPELKVLGRYDLTKDLLMRCRQAHFYDWKQGYAENLKLRNKVKDKPI
jgi:hypothetical protein